MNSGASASFPTRGPLPSTSTSPKPTREAERRADALTRSLACPACKSSLGAAQRCAGCGRSWGTEQGRPVLRAEGVVPRVEAQALPAQALARKGITRGGLRGLADRVRSAANADLFADDRKQVAMLVEKLFGTLPGERLLEVGAGEQYYLDDLRRLGDIVAMDVSIYGPTDVIGDCHALPFVDRSFDGIVAVEVLEHLERPWVFFEEAARVLTPGGALFGVTPQYCPTHGFPHDYFRFTKDGIGSLARHAGMTLECAWPIGGPWGTLLHWYWANHAREHFARKLPVLGVAYHAWFQGVAKALDALDSRQQYGAKPRGQEHEDHVGWSFIVRKPK